MKSVNQLLAELDLELRHPNSLNRLQDFFTELDAVFFLIPITKY